MLEWTRQKGEGSDPGTLLNMRDSKTRDAF